MASSLAPLLAGDNNSKEEKAKYTGICASCQWFKANPIGNWKFGLLLLFGFLTPVWAAVRFVSRDMTGDILAGVFGLILALFGASHFRTLLNLKEQVDRYAGLNNTFKHENMALDAEVNKLRMAQQQLSSAANDLRTTTKGYKENVQKMKQLDEQLHSMSSDSIQGLEQIQQMSKFVQDSFTKELEQNERNILFTVQEAMELKDNSDGLSEQEYQNFVSALPQSFQARFRTISFAEKSGDDGTLDIDEFKNLCDEFAKQQAAAKAAEADNEE
mmetsp:Transcript_41225/g.67816  ORF Transcript_41225/g.67816 Transcript_41225/m.67816 type:complete len:272 (-) Transcript_41225:202-1017(-)